MDSDLTSSVSDCQKAGRNGKVVKELESRQTALSFSGVKEGNN